MQLNLWDRIGHYPSVGSLVHRIEVKSISFDISGVKLQLLHQDSRNHLIRLGFQVNGNEAKMSLGQFIDLIDKIVE